MKTQTTTSARSQSLKIAKVRKVRQALTTDIIWVSFFKLTGERVTKRGTRKPAFIPRPHAPVFDIPQSERLITFYSHNDGQWISFEPDRLISYSVA